MLRRSDANACPSCGGCMPFEGPPSAVCRCGSDWGDLNELIRLLDELLSDPPPADTPARLSVPGLPPTEITPTEITTPEETDHG